MTVTLLDLIMTLTWVHVFPIFLFSSSGGEYITGVGRHHRMQLKLVIQDINGCVKHQQLSSLLHSYENQLVCFRKHMFHCLLKSNAISEKGASQSYCGAISLKDIQMVSSDTVMFIGVIAGHVVHHDVLKFNFKTSRYYLCSQHGLLLLYKGYTSDSYCGRRVPWKMTIPTDSSYLRLVIKRYMYYELSIFYSTSQKNWIKHFIYAQMSFLLAGGMTMIGDSGKSMQYYVMVYHLQRVRLHVISTGPVYGSVLVKDGPGRLSSTIMELRSTNSSTDIQATTSAYWAFVEILLLYTTNAVFKIRLHPTSAAGSVRRCYGHDQIDFAETSSDHRNVICSNFLHTASPNEFIKLTVHTFSFHGANKLTDKSFSRCQYGGITIEFYPGDKGLQLCEDLRDFDISSKYDSIQITLVWFYGYSRGQFVAGVTSSQCQTVYLERYPSPIVYKHDVFVKMGPRPQCYYVICPPVHMDIQRSCTIELGPPSLTAASLEITTLNTLEPCNIHLKQMYLNKFISYNLSAMSTENWPFGPIKSTRAPYKQYFMAQNHTYDFLNDAKIKLRLLCEQDDPLKQMAVLIRMSACGNNQDKSTGDVVNNIPTISASCLKMTYLFTSVKTKMKKTNNHNNYHNFIYALNGHTGHNVFLNYESCPEDCRSFKYTVYVRNTGDNDIMEYTAQVGHDIFTGYSHRGFRIKMIVPETDCVNVCLMTLVIDIPDLPINTKDYDLGVYIFVNDRWCLAFNMYILYTDPSYHWVFDCIIGSF